MVREACQWALTRKREHSGPVRVPSSLLEHLQRRVALKPVSESGFSLGAEAVHSKTASTGEEVSTGADKKANTLWGGGALQVCDLRLAEDGGECSGALVSNAIELETARDGWGQ